MYVILLWPSKIKSSLILMQNVFNVCALRTNWLKILILEDLGWIQVFFKNFSSHTHAFFIIKQCTLRSFYIKMLCFSKIWFFQTFDRSNLFFDQSKLRLNFWFESAWLDWCSIDSRSIATEKFSVSMFLTKNFFHASFVFRIHIHCIVFVSILQFYSHISHYFHT